MQTDDVGRVLAIQEEGSVAALGHIYPQDIYPFPRSAVQERWMRELADSGTDCFVIQDCDYTICGFAAIRGDELLHFGTARSTWGSGLAGQAHDELLDRLRRREVQPARLWVLEANSRARRFYEHRGWAATDRRTRATSPPQPVLIEYHYEFTTSTPP